MPTFRFISVWLIAAVSFSRCGNAGLQTAGPIDLDRYMGTWYEIAALPGGKHKNCHCTAFDYKWSGNGEYIMVINSCIKKGKQGAILAKAFVNENTGGAVWSMEFFWPFSKSYTVLAVDSGYTWAMAGLPDRKSLWLMSRTKEMDHQVYRNLVQQAARLGYDVSQLEKTIHSCNLENS